MKTDADIGFFTKILLIIVTKLQEQMIKLDEMDFYYALVRLKFKLYWGYDIYNASAWGREFEAARKVHGNMIVSLLYPESPRGAKVAIFELAKDNFIKRF